MSDFKAKMHQIQFRLELRPRPRWGSLQRFPRPLVDLRGLLLRGGRKGGEVKGGRGWEGRKREGKGREGKRKGGSGRKGEGERGRKGKGGAPPKKNLPLHHRLSLNIIIFV